jgi:hypothetical protein
MLNKTECVPSMSMCTLFRGSEKMLKIQIFGVKRNSDA